MCHPRPAAVVHKPLSNMSFCPPLLLPQIESYSRHPSAPLSTFSSRLLSNQPSSFHGSNEGERRRSFRGGRDGCCDGDRDGTVSFTAYTVIVQRHLTAERGTVWSARYSVPKFVGGGASICRVSAKLGALKTWVSLSFEGSIRNSGHVSSILFVPHF